MSLFSQESKNKIPKFIDVHSHVSFSEYDQDRGAVFDRMRYANVKTITVGTDLQSSKEAVEMANQYGESYACIGLHPADNKKESFNSKDYEELTNNLRVVAVGECGLDYYRIKETDVEEKERQKKEFEKQIQFAIEHNLPLMLHCRPKQGSMDAYVDTLSLLQKYKKGHGEKLRGNSHFFAGDKEIAKQFVDMDFTLSFTGVITFTNDYDEIIKATPKGMLLSETDSPFVAPVPHRGKRNEPTYVQAVVKRLSELKGENYENMAEIIVKNSYRVFQFKDE
jgi:TatD DNase family protein